MKNRIRYVIVFCIAASVVMIFHVNWDHGLNCTRCGYYEHRLEHRFFGITFWETVMSRHDKYGRNYKDVFGTNCTHALRKGGFGHNPGCGMTAEGSVFQGRNRAVRAMFDAYSRNTNRLLVQRSLALIEELFPEQTTVQGYYRGRSEETNMVTVGEMILYSEWLDLVQTNEEWEQVNEAAQNGFVVLPSFVRDEKLMRTKMNAQSPVVRKAAEQVVRYPPKPL